LAELHKILMWMSRGTDVIRPGAAELVSYLMSTPEIVFAIASAVSNWYLLPSVRSILMKAFPGTEWRVDENFEGMWTSYSEGTSYNMSGTLLTAIEDSEWPPPPLQVTFDGHDSCSVEFVPGQVRRGRLTADGFLEWDFGDQKWIWVRAGRKEPPCLVCAATGMRLYVFDKETITEQICEKDETDESDQEQTELAGSQARSSTESPKEADGWIWLRKELHTAWSALSEARCGHFGASNTVHLDELTDFSSHPDNVIRVPQWSDCEDGSAMATMQAYLSGLVADSSTSVGDYLKTHPHSATHQASIFDQCMEEKLTRKRQKVRKSAALEQSSSGNANKENWMCSTPACQKPSWNRSPGEYCSRACRNGPQQVMEQSPVRQ